MPEQTLAGVRVLDLTNYIAGPYCTKVLADFGADVLKIEKPDGGDGARKIGPFYHDEPHLEKSGLFLYLNTNKRGITLNLKSETGKKIFKKLVKDTDILVESFSPKVMPGLGLDYETLVKENPKLVMTSISNFGQTGPYRDYKASEIIEFGMGGNMIACGLPGREPMKLGGSINLYHAGFVAVEPTLIALSASEFQGLGQHIDISIMEIHLSSCNRRVMALIGAGYNPGEKQTRVGEGSAFPGGPFQCKDGYVWVVGGVPQWRQICAMIDRPDLEKDTRFCTPLGQSNKNNRDEFNAIFKAWCMERTMQEIVALGHVTKNIILDFNTVGDMVEHPQMAEREFFIEIEHPVVGKLKYPGAPIKMAETPFEIRRPAPLLGQHNNEVYGQLGYSREDLVRLRETGVI